ncbi:hypothetical protein EDD22DRAFT_330941 [Suillus occidentalis]|nr:hypothetical protein EDD22DRAFT_330941 [Suillus occidentalis]
MMIAQRAHIGLKIKASIAIIRKRYWRGIAVGMNFIGFTMLDCFSKIHEDIVGVWNLYDPDGHLVSEKFKNPIVNDLDKNFPHTGEAVSGFDLITKIMALLEPLAHADPTGVFSTVVMTFSTAVVVVGWAYETYQQTNDALQRIMTYIVDLTCIMQILFLLCSHLRPPPPAGPIPPPKPISLSAIKIAIDAYEGAGKSNIHSEVKSRVSVAHAKGDDVLDEIDKLINHHSIKDEEVQDLRRKLRF